MINLAAIIIKWVKEIIAKKNSEDKIIPKYHDREKIFGNSFIRKTICGETKQE